MDKTFFVNQFLSLGMYDYFNDKRDNIFERHIVECLCDIYGTSAIKKCYDEKDENAFTTLIYSYGLTSTVYDNFLRDTVKYEEFREKNKENPSLKSDVASLVESSIITMFLYKCLIEEPSLETLSHFENDLLNDFSIIKLHFNTSLEPNKTRTIWEKKKKLLSNNVELVEIKPEYLDEFTYSRFGIDIEKVKEMDYRMVAELNKYIKSKMTELEAPKEEKKKKPLLSRNTIISSGNGLVDALLIMSIIAAEMSIGIIYLFLHM